MPVTRSASRGISAAVANAVSTTVTPTRGKRKAKSDAPANPQASKKPRAGEVSASAESPVKLLASIPPPVSAAAAPVFLPAVLSFSFEDAKRHLIRADPRFEDLFEKLPCRPFEQLERVDPFRTLVTSILGQQISWLAARSITHRFIRIYDPTLPEKLDPGQDGSVKPSYTIFPSPQQVSVTDVATLKSAGLSTRKAEYVQDLAARFADGRLSTTKILEADDEELANMLIEVRGIGRWTVDMFAIFSLRRPDILPIGDLGVQRGVLRWILSLHSPAHSFIISPKKLAKPQPVTPKAEADAVTGSSQDIEPVTDDKEAITVPVASEGVSSVPPAPPSTPKKGARRGKIEEEPVSDVIAAPPPLFTPSINKTLHRSLPGNHSLAPLPDGLTPAVLKSRLDSKKKIKGAFLTPQEMEALTEGWRPYRSLGVFYMWALAEDKAD